jgi:hypothetical protein
MIIMIMIKIIMKLISMIIMMLNMLIKLLIMIDHMELEFIDFIININYLKLSNLIHYYH